MERIFKEIKNTINHLETLHNIFINKNNFDIKNKISFGIYEKNEELLNLTLNKLKFYDQLYNYKGRQMILADFFEYIFLGRGYYSIKKIEDKKNFVKAILYFVNLLMCFEEMTISNDLRKKYLHALSLNNENVTKEDQYYELINFNGKIGLKKGESGATKKLDKYFDSFFPKTAGGLWHELLVYIFLLRNDIGYIIPLLLSQRLLSGKKYIIPPDFLIITYNKDLYGIEVGTKKKFNLEHFHFKQIYQLLLLILKTLEFLIDVQYVKGGFLFVILL